MTNIFHQHLTADANHNIHISLPSEMGDDVEVIVLSRKSPDNDSLQECLLMAQLIDESGFAKNVLNSTVEDCWNDL